MSALSDAIAQSQPRGAYETAQDTRDRRGATWVGAPEPAARRARGGGPGDFPRRPDRAVDRRRRARRKHDNRNPHSLPAGRSAMEGGPGTDARQGRRARRRYPPADGVHRTPVGTFTFDQAFGRQPNPGTKMPYFKATDQDWWDEDAGSPTYNTHVRGSGSPSSIAENLYDSGPVYDYAVNIAVNPQRIPGRVAGIFLHVSDGNPTWGCVAIGRNEMRSVLNWLDPSASPQITIGVGTPSLAPSGS